MNTTSMNGRYTESTNAFLPGRASSPYGRPSSRGGAARGTKGDTNQAQKKHKAGAGHKYVWPSPSVAGIQTKRSGTKVGNKLREKNRDHLGVPDLFPIFLTDCTDLFPIFGVDLFPDCPENAPFPRRSRTYRVHQCTGLPCRPSVASLLTFLPSIYVSLTRRV